MTSYSSIAHGQAVGVTLSSLLVFNTNVTNKDVVDKRGFGYVRKTINDICKLLWADSVGSAKATIDSLIFEIGLQTRLSKLGL